MELGITQKDISVPWLVFAQHGIDDETPRLAFVRHAADFALEGDHRPRPFRFCPVTPTWVFMGLEEGKLWRAMTSKKWTSAERVKRCSP